MKTLILWLFVYFGGLLLSVVHPIYPFVSYLAFYYMPPQKNDWGNSLPDGMRWSLMASAAMAAALFFRSTNLERLKPVKNPALKWFVLLGVNVCLVTTWALNMKRSWYWAVVMVKLVILYALIPATVRTPAHFDIFATTHIAGATYWGWKAWDDPKRKAGRLKDVGGPDTQNENQAAAHLLTVMPFVAVYVLSTKRRLVQGALLVAGAFIVNVFILCNSRGATLSLLAMVVAAIFLAGKGRRMKLIGVGGAALVLLLALADTTYLERQQTTLKAKDGSAQSRLVFWKAGLEVIKDYPLGGGGRAFHILSPKYAPELFEKAGDEERSSHNMYIQLGTEWGIQGMVLWFGFMGSTMIMLWKQRRRARNEPWYYYRFLCIELALIGTFAYGMFGNRLYGEGVYWMCALAYSLVRMHVTATATAEEEAAVPVAVAPTLSPAERPAATSA